MVGGARSIMTRAHPRAAVNHCSYGLGSEVGTHIHLRSRPGLEPMTLYYQTATIPMELSIKNITFVCTKRNDLFLK